MTQAHDRKPVRFLSGGEHCAAWHYPGDNGACVVMAGGFAVNKEPATDRFAERFARAGFSVLAFDYRRLGESEGQPRLVLPVSDALADWRAAIAFAQTLPEVDRTRVAIWGFSAAGGHVFRLAAEGNGVAAAITQAPLADAPASAPAVGRYSTPLAQFRLMGRAMRDTVRGLFGRPPLLVPLAGEKGTVAMLSTPDALEADQALRGADYPQWEQQVAARSVLGIGFYRPARHAARIECPLLVMLCDNDRSSIPAPAVRAAERAPRGELVRLPGGHYAPFTDGHEQAVETQLRFLTEHLLERHDSPSADSPGIDSPDGQPAQAAA